MYDWLKKWISNGGNVHSLGFAVVKRYRERLPSGRRPMPVWDCIAIDIETGVTLDTCGHNHHCPGSARDCKRAADAWRLYHQQQTR